MCGQSNNNDKVKKNCQCDGNCDCGKILPNGDISCDNCGWKAQEAFNTLTGNHVCPSCRTESPYSNDVKPKNNTMKHEQTNQTRDNLSNGLVGLATANAGFLNWSEDPIGRNNGVNNTESNFAEDVSSQNMIGFAAGQDWTVLNPFKSKGNGNTESAFAEDVSSQNMVGFGIGQNGLILNPFGKGGAESGYISEEDKKLAEEFYRQSQEFDIAESQSADESGMGGNLGNFIDKTRGLYSKITPSGIIARDVWSGKYCKSLGYMKKADRGGFTKCKNSTKINYVKAKKGQWTYPAAPEGAESEINLDQLAADTMKEVDAIPQSQVDAAANRTGDVPATKSNATLYWIIGIVLLLVIIAVIIVIMRRRAAQGK
jgi:hypothetical protein